MTETKSIIAIQNYIYTILEKFSEKLIYHNKTHVDDVFNSASEIAICENISDNEVFLLKTAALYHDIGFIETYNTHEDVSKKIAMQSLPSFGFGDSDILKICNMIEATKIPQTPKCHLEKIICDADLDNLGREDFFNNMELLFLEKKNFGFINDKTLWYKQTFDMLKSHEYFCKSSKIRRSSIKQNNIQKLKQLIENNFSAQQ